MKKGFKFSIFKFIIISVLKISNFTEKEFSPVVFLNISFVKFYGTESK